MDEMISRPADVTDVMHRDNRTLAKTARGGWAQAHAPLHTCAAGCHRYVRQWGKAVRYAVLHYSWCRP